MQKSAAIHQKTHMSPQWRGTWRAPACIPPPRLQRGGAGLEWAAGSRAARRLPLSPQGSLNRSLRRYVQASSLRVWLRRRARAIGDATAPGGSGGSFRALGWPAEAAGCIRPPLVRERADGVSRVGARALEYRASRNRQMEHLVKAAVSLRGGVRRGSAITPRECADAEDLVLATLGSKAGVQSNIFGFVMT
jgi:hypothetical protein